MDLQVTIHPAVLFPSPTRSIEDLSRNLLRLVPPTLPCAGNY